MTCEDSSRPDLLSLDSSSLSWSSNNDELLLLQQKKENDIVCCLNGHPCDDDDDYVYSNNNNKSNETVNLCQLRGFASSKGGFLSSSLRKQVWPKLVATYQDVLLSSSSSSLSSPLETVSTQDYTRLQREIPLTKWHMEAHVLYARRQRLQMLDTAAAAAARRVVDDDTSKPMGNHQMELNTILEGSCETVPSPLSGAGTPVHGCRNWATRPPAVLSQHEQALLSSIVVNFLRTPPSDQDNPHYEHDRHCYFAGLNDLTALLLIGLESPSLTKCVLQKLGEWHLRDASRPTTTVLEGTLEMCFSVLIQAADPQLANHLNGMRYPTAAVGWIGCWFAREFANANVASRLVDFFLANHAIAPLYFCIALLATEKSKAMLLQTDSSDTEGLQNVVASLPSSLLQDDAEPVLMGFVEQVIADTVSLLQALPVDSLCNHLGRSDHACLLPSIAMLAPACLAPPWAVAPHAPTDWALMQQSKSIRQSSPRGVVDFADIPEPALDKCVDTIMTDTAPEGDPDDDDDVALKSDSLAESQRESTRETSAWQLAPFAGLLPLLMILVVTSFANFSIRNGPSSPMLRASRSKVSMAPDAVAPTTSKVADAISFETELVDRLVVHSEGADTDTNSSSMEEENVQPFSFTSVCVGPSHLFPVEELTEPIADPSVELARDSEIYPQNTTRAPCAATSATSDSLPLSSKQPEAARNQSVSPRGVHQTHSALDEPIQFALDARVPDGLYVAPIELYFVDEELSFTTTKPSDELRIPPVDLEQCAPKSKVNTQNTTSIPRQQHPFAIASRTQDSPLFASKLVVHDLPRADQIHSAHTRNVEIEDDVHFAMDGLLVVEEEPSVTTTETSDQLQCMSSFDFASFVPESNLNMENATATQPQNPSVVIASRKEDSFFCPSKLAETVRNQSMSPRVHQTPSAHKRNASVHDTIQFALDPTVPNGLFVAPRELYFAEEELPVATTKVSGDFLHMAPVDFEQSARESKVNTTSIALQHPFAIASGEEDSIPFPRKLPEVSRNRASGHQIHSARTHDVEIENVIHFDFGMDGCCVPAPSELESVEEEPSVPAAEPSDELQCMPPFDFEQSASDSKTNPLDTTTSTFEKPTSSELVVVDDDVEQQPFFSPEGGRTTSTLVDEGFSPAFPDLFLYKCTGEGKLSESTVIASESVGKDVQDDDVKDPAVVRVHDVVWRKDYSRVVFNNRRFRHRFGDGHHNINNIFLLSTNNERRTRN